MTRSPLSDAPAKAAPKLSPTERAAKLRSVRKTAQTVSSLDGLAARAAVLALAPELKSARLLNSPVFGSDTALSLACRERDTKLARALISLGASPNAPRETSDSALCRVLFGAAKTPTRITAALACMKFMLKSGAEIGHANDAGEQIILVSSLDPRLIEITRWLLSRGADPSATAHNGMTPLHYAAQRGDLPTAILFIEAGADLSLKAESRGKISTPAEMAESWIEYHQNYELLSILKDATQAAFERETLESSIKPAASVRRSGL